MIRTLSLGAVLAATLAFPALAQTTPTQPTTPPAVVAKPSAVSMMLTADEAKKWIGKPVYSNDDKKVGEIAAFARGTDNSVTEMHADTGGFLGIGETRVKVMPAQFKLESDRAVLNLTSEQAKGLPAIVK
jgi:PRC-barrel domain